MKYLLLLFFIIALMVYYTVFGERGLLYLKELRGDVARIAAMSEEVSQENEKLKKEIELLQTDKRYVEKVAGEELGLVREDEIIYKKAH